MLWQGHSALPKTFSVILVNDVNKVTIIMISCVSVLAITCLFNLVNVDCMFWIQFSSNHCSLLFELKLHYDVTTHKYGHLWYQLLSMDTTVGLSWHVISYIKEKFEWKQLRLFWKLSTCQCQVAALIILWLSAIRAYLQKKNFWDKHVFRLHSIISFCALKTNSNLNCLSCYEQDL